MRSVVVVASSSSPPPPPHLSYVYSEINSMEYNNNKEEVYHLDDPEWRYQHHHRQNPLDDDEVTETPSRVMSSLSSTSSFSTHTEGGWFHVSGQAIMCHGGESFQQDLDHPVLYVDASILNSVEPDFSEREYEADDDDDNEDEDDEDDDGHSSMLSNSAALYRRPRAMVGSGTVVASASTRDSSYTSSSSYDDATTPESSASNTNDMEGQHVTLQPQPRPEQAQRTPWCRTLPVTKAFSPRVRI